MDIDWEFLFFGYIFVLENSYGGIGGRHMTTGHEFQTLLDFFEITIPDL
jgi:hypothetical protein